VRPFARFEATGATCSAVPVDDEDLDPARAGVLPVLGADPGDVALSSAMARSMARRRTGIPRNSLVSIARSSICCAAWFASSSAMIRATNDSGSSCSAACLGIIPV